MSFQPRMSASLSGISVIEDLKCRSWSYAVADVWHARAAAGASAAYVSPDPRLFIVLEHEGGEIDLRLSPDGPVAVSLSGAGSLSYIPAGVALWSRNRAGFRIRHLDIHLDLASLGERFGEAIDRERLSRPQLALTNPDLMALATLVARECSMASLHSLYGDGLILALIIGSIQLGPAPQPNRGVLAAWQLRRTKAYIEEHCMRAIRLRELAELTGLSQSYFSQAFKLSTGMPPHTWQMQARMRRVKKLLVDRNLSIRDIAVMAGFADQAHLTRTFRRFAGVTPASWRREHGGPSVD